MIRWPRNSLALRIFVYVGLTMLVATLVIVTIVLYEFRGHIQVLQQHGLREQAAVIARHLQLDASGKAQLKLPAPLLLVYGSEPEEAQYAVLNDRGDILSASARATPALTATLARGAAGLRQFRFYGEDNEHEFQAVSLRKALAGQAYFIQVARDGDQEGTFMNSVLGEFFDEVIWVMLLLYALILLVMFWTVKSVLKPLQAVSRQASAIEPGSFEIRLPTEKIPDEILPVIVAMNKALDRLQAGYRIQREFTANAAHEIRTPLAVLRAHIEASGGGGGSGEQDLCQDLARVERIVAQLLNLAQMDNLVLDEFSGVDLHALAVDCAAQLAPLAIRYGKQLAVTGARQVVVQGNATVLGSAARNLLENAIFYSQSGRDIEIRIDASPALSVLDNGPGLAAADCENVFKRFWRGPVERQGGAGLGLSIVAMIAEAHHARVFAANRQTGGAVFTITFPQTN